MIVLGYLDGIVLAFVAYSERNAFVAYSKRSAFLAYCERNSFVAYSERNAIIAYSEKNAFVAYTERNAFVAYSKRMHSWRILNELLLLHVLCETLWRTQYDFLVFVYGL
ncbi:hypothetical protein PVK06_017064 [Gossypium arboreum]|uniref:Uncharacterized protein n=1 Tax=Gossypium arboreum TaxID=29729 RepID=A0ABR0Q1N5_GOSAR|nr:hypothetical protein PVK06_017064 [Gossypium arboreum]